MIQTINAHSMSWSRLKLGFVRNHEGPFVRSESAHNYIFCTERWIFMKFYEIKPLQTNRSHSFKSYKTNHTKMWIQ